MRMPTRARRRVPFFPTALVAVLLTACGSHAHSRVAAPRSVNQSSALLAAGYTVSYRVTAFGLNGAPLYVYRSVCTGSADGHCQKVFFFDGTRYLGTDTLNDSAAINSVSNAGAQTIAVTYANYAPNDPLCCPSGKPVTITYYWNGTKLTPSGTPPGHKP